jgi:hypothetical protein
VVRGESRVSAKADWQIEVVRRFEEAFNQYMGWDAFEHQHESIRKAALVGVRAVFDMMYREEK